MYAFLMNLLSKVMPKSQKGQDITEYALLVALIAIAVVAAIIFFGDEVSSFFSDLGASVQGWFS